VASCDSTVRFWLNAKQLKDRQLWQPGWQSTQEIAVWQDETEKL
ncbi:MAG: TIGR02450 family Trp-rich protein, partial [Microcoleaceae cyanobacterium]